MWYTYSRLIIYDMEILHMDEFIKLLDPNLDYICHEIIGDTIVIHVASNKEEVICPYCGCASSKKHSVYERSFQDLPVMGMKSRIVLSNRKMFCTNPECSRTTFAEPFSFIGPKAKKSNRLLDKIVDVSLNVSSLNAADILKNGIADVGKSTICNLLKKRYTPSR
ncbi:MAG: transposase family protein [Lachnospiraceae bacterium]|nr:transposase family protein [Lachnospiraceae bacterium]